MSSDFKGFRVSRSRILGTLKDFGFQDLGSKALGFRDFKGFRVSRSRV